MDKIYAQILLETNQVNLIGGTDVGLPIKHHLVNVIDITDRSDKNEIKLGMSYDETMDTFSFIEPTPLPHTEPTQLDRIEELQLNSLITNEYVASLIELGI